MTTEGNQSRCQRCGRCCWLRINDKKKKCKYLVVHGTYTSCRIYHKRLGAAIGEIDGKRWYCTLRDRIAFNFVGCPFNKEGVDILE